ncbi:MULTISPECIES: hypothetical protein [Pseudonocardia]|uniref:ABC-2 family transporter protein n=2 Tax=Pseudonocardia TaxID=1847 RepID=A0A1Y2N2Z9_PSEAH|nr:MULTISPECIES: hypothetical protein [Pseudonocardia]OSY41561.1 ABC-2 family transporter protein [Pseudonocardia autotrophica]TDN71516.1 ABC-2 type transport system permease protein [Pseudonocardia autotrophica]BBG02195.1 ABC transporter [Pseudonocardia autotrophica]GEC24209.1 ABC transporter [Pseudonocardia saturnea]
MNGLAGEQEVGVRPGFGAVVASEWIKLWAVRSTWHLLGVVLALTVGLSAVMAFFGSAGDLAAAQADGEYNVVLFSAGLGVWVYCYFGAALVASEFGGTGYYTFVATPGRGRVLAAKALIVAACGPVLGSAIAVSAVLLTQVGLTATGAVPLDLADPTLWRAALGYVVLSMTVQGVLAALVAVLVRNAIGALGVVLLLLNALPVMLAEFLGETYRNSIPRFMPGAAVESVAGLSVPGSAGYLPTGVAATVLAAWVGIAWIAAHRRLATSDIR